MFRKIAFGIFVRKVVAQSINLKFFCIPSTSILGQNNRYSSSQTENKPEVTNETEEKPDIVKTFLELEKLSPNVYRSYGLLPSLPGLRRVYGGQIYAQSLVAAQDTVPTVFYPHSVHCYFIKAAVTDTPIQYEVEQFRDGRSYCTRFIKATQHGENLFTCQISFTKDEQDSVIHQREMSKVALPEKCPDAAQLLRTQIERADIGPKEKSRFVEKLYTVPMTYDMRPTNVDDFLGDIATTEPYYSFWVKARGPIGPICWLHQCVASFIIDGPLIPSVLWLHATTTGFQPSMFSSLDHCMWFHRCRFFADDWMLFEMESTVAVASRAFIHARLWTKDGALVMSATQEALIRSKKKV